jgi:hypothetical protein
MPRTTITPAVASTITPTTQRALFGFAAVPQPQPGPQQAVPSFTDSAFSGCFLSLFGEFIVRCFLFGSLFLFH